MRGLLCLALVLPGIAWGQGSYFWLDPLGTPTVSSLPFDSPKVARGVEPNSFVVAWEEVAAPLVRRVKVAQVLVSLGELQVGAVKTLNELPEGSLLEALVLSGNRYLVLTRTEPSLDQGSKVHAVYLNASTLALDGPVTLLAASVHRLPKVAALGDGRFALALALPNEAGFSRVSVNVVHPTAVITAPTLPGEQNEQPLAIACSDDRCAVLAEVESAIGAPALNALFFWPTLSAAPAHNQALAPLGQAWLKTGEITLGALPSETGFHLVGAVTVDIGGFSSIRSFYFDSANSVSQWSELPVSEGSGLDRQPVITVSGTTIRVVWACGSELCARKLDVQGNPEELVQQLSKGGSFDRPDAAWNGKILLVGAQDSARPVQLVRLAALDGAGNHLAGWAAPQSPVNKQINPAVSFDGTDFWSAWEESSGLFVQRIRRDSKPGPGVSMRLSGSSGATAPALASCNPITRAVWTTRGTSVSNVVTMTLGGFPTQLSAYATPSSAAVGCNGESFLVAWLEQGAWLQGRWFPQENVPQEPSGIALTQGSTGLQLAGGPLGYVLAWKDASGVKVGWWRTGTEAPVIETISEQQPSSGPTVAFGDGRFLLAWTVDGKLSIAEVEVVEGDLRQIRTIDGLTGVANPKLAWDGTQWLLVTTVVSSSPFHLQQTLLSTELEPVGDPLALELGSPPALAAGKQGQVLAVFSQEVAADNATSYHLRGRLLGSPTPPARKVAVSLDRAQPAHDLLPGSRMTLLVSLSEEGRGGRATHLSFVADGLELQGVDPEVGLVLTATSLATSPVIPISATVTGNAKRPVSLEVIVRDGSSAGKELVREVKEFEVSNATVSACQAGGDARAPLWPLALAAALFGIRLARPPHRRAFARPPARR